MSNTNDPAVQAQHAQDALDDLYVTLVPMRQQVAALEEQEHRLLPTLMSATIRTLVPKATYASFDTHWCDNGYFFEEDPTLTLSDGSTGALSELSDGTILEEDLTGSLSGTYNYLQRDGIEVDLVHSKVVGGLAQSTKAS